MNAPLPLTVVYVLYALGLLLTFGTVLTWI
jgi:hypothetical protein